MIPIHGAKSNALSWLKGRGAAGIEPETCFVFSEASFEPGLEELAEYVQSGTYISWLGGPGIDGVPWPTNANGTALAHVASFCLNEAQLHPEMAASWGPGLNLPDGYLEIYHDLETYGGSPEDRESQGWLVRYVEPRDGYGLVPPPGHSPDPVAGTECQLGLMMPGFTIPAYPDLEASGSVSVSFENWEECLLELADVWHLQRFGKKAGYQIPYTHLGGHSWDGKVEVADLLSEALPLGDGDEHLLLAVVESWTTLNGWFGDAGNLEVWIRKSDLDSRAFSSAWCVIRTG